MVYSGFGLNRFKLHRHLVDETVKSVWFRQVFGLLRVWFRQVLGLLRVWFRQVFGLLRVWFRQVFDLLRVRFRQFHCISHLQNIIMYLFHISVD